MNTRDDNVVITTLQYIRDLTKDWEIEKSPSRSETTSLFEFIRLKRKDCFLKAQLAQLLLTLLGYSVEIVRGYYCPPQENRWMRHVWIRVNGREYDATSGDFHIDPERHSYTNPDPNDQGLKTHDWDTIIPERTRY
ncbi:MAG: hypothetical protein V1685_03615 [Parcubacteria group bacterium]